MIHDKFHPSQRAWPSGMPESIAQTEHRGPVCEGKCEEGMCPGKVEGEGAKSFCAPWPSPKLNLVHVYCPNTGCEWHVRVDEKVKEYNLSKHMAEGCAFTSSLGRASRTPQEASGGEDSPGSKGFLTTQEKERTEAPTAVEVWNGLWWIKGAQVTAPVNGQDPPLVPDDPSLMPRYPVVEFPSGLKRDSTEGKINYLLTRDGPLLKRWAELLTRGAAVKGARNWLKAGSNPDTAQEDLERFREGAARHFEQWLAGETDEDHAAAVIFNLNGAEHVKGQME